MNAQQIITETLMRIEGDPDRKLFEGYAETILRDLQSAGYIPTKTRMFGPGGLMEGPSYLGVSIREVDAISKVTKSTT